MAAATDQTVQLRLVHIVYSTHLEHEDGNPGSLTNPVSDKSEPRYTPMGSMSMSQAEKINRRYVERVLHRQLERDSDDGFEEHSYQIQWHDPDSDEWRFLANL